MKGDRDKRLTAWIISLLNLKGVGSKTIVDFLSHNRAEICRSDTFDADFAEKLALGIPKAARIARALQDADIS